MKMATGLSMLLAGALVFLFSASQASAQARRVTAPGTGAVQPAAGKEGVVIRKMEATGPNARVKTPEFRNDANEPQSQARDWARAYVKTLEAYTAEFPLQCFLFHDVWTDDRNEAKPS